MLHRLSMLAVAAALMAVSAATGHLLRTTSPSSHTQMERLNTLSDAVDTMIGTKGGGGATSSAAAAAATTTPESTPVNVEQRFHGMDLQQAEIVREKIQQTREKC